MAGPAPKTETWTAHENLHDYKEKADHLHLLVGGTVEVSDADKQPVLKQASGGGPKALMHSAMFRHSPRGRLPGRWEAGGGI